MRERKTKRSEYKTELMERNFRKKTFAAALVKNKKEVKAHKKDKFSYCPHFIDMEVICEKEGKENTESEAKLKKNSFLFSKRKKETRSLQNSPKKSKTHPVVSHMQTARKWSPLVSQDRQLVLTSSENIKLSQGVSLREEPSKSLGLSISGHNGISTRKRLQFLKNNEHDPVKIKLS